MPTVPGCQTERVSEHPDDGAGLQAVLARAAGEVYAVAPGAFVASRTDCRRRALADDTLAPADRKAAGRAIAALRKPTSAAWLVNGLVRTDPGLVERVAEVGGRLRRAQARLDASALRDLRSERDAVLDEAIRALPAVTEGVDGAPAVTDATRGEVRATLVAALSDASAMDAVSSGTLTRALSYSGLGEVDLSDAVGLTPTGVRLRVVPDSAGDDADGPSHGDGDGSEEGADEPAEETGPAEDPTDLRERERALEEAEDAVAEAGAAVKAARDEAKAARARVETLRADLREAIDADERAMAAVTDAVRARTEAERARQRAEDALADDA